MSPEAVSTRPLLDKLGVKPGLRVAVVDLDDPAFMKLLRERTSDVVSGKPRGRCDIVILGATEKRDLTRLKDAKRWIEPNGAIWVVRQKGAGAPIKDTELIAAGLAAGLVDNKIASFSDTHGAMRFVFRLRDRPK
jgi:NADPH-dependent 2,4-dienoyl-CoA reductase/sulfur reductase-like enzyme